MEGRRVHFIAIGGSAMHNLALALHHKGYTVTGSDDEIFDPARSRLAACGLLPENFGWFPEKLTTDIDAIILGMHARGDNPELARARRMGLKIYSYPEFLYEQSKDKLRVVIGGSHGKTTITAMILHVLRYAKIDCDYMVGAKLEGFDVMVKLTEKAPFMVFEGDEYLTSALDPRPKFHLYKPDIALISGIAWDHMNVFPTFDKYVEQFRIFAGMVPENGCLIYCEADEEVKKVASKLPGKMEKQPYSVPDYRIENGKTILITDGGDVPLKVFGRHNLMNLEGARHVCRLLEVDDKTFYEAISTYGGAANRLELLAQNERTSIYRDFAHAPSKLKATIEAAKEQFPDRWLVACFELHTYSSLSKNFLSQYAGCMDKADQAIVYFSPHALHLKKLPMLKAEDIVKAFGKKRMEVFTAPDKFQSFLQNSKWEDANLLLMSSGNFDGINVKELSAKLIS
ncbi:MAG: peptidoglycan synthetase [Bacteroidetes bacterium]|nr:peptidoglycan synthetase [Bacteroidota bacterium]